MNQKTTLSINTPCSQKFDNFLSTEKGGYCNSCEKEVIDFRNWTDKEVSNHFKTTTQKTCGYFKAEQLKTYTDEPVLLQRNNSFRNVGLASVSLLSFFSFNSAFSQTKEEATIIQTENKNKDNKVDEPSIGIIVKGIVSDDNGMPLPSANVAIKNSNISVTTDFDGEFSFPKPLNEGTILLVNYVGYKTQEIKVTRETNYISLKMYESMLCGMVGEVSVNKVYQSKPSFVQRVKTWFKND